MYGPRGPSFPIASLKTTSGGSTHNSNGYSTSSGGYAMGDVVQRLRVPTGLVRTKIAPNSQKPSVTLASSSSSPTHVRRQIRTWPNRR
jgi:hypothetical protein